MDNNGVVELPQADVTTPLPIRIAGRHHWMIAAAWTVDPETWEPGTRAELDETNLISLSGIGCYWCGKEYDPNDKGKCQWPKKK